MGPHMAEPLRDEITAVVHSCPIHLEGILYYRQLPVYVYRQLVKISINKPLLLSFIHSKKEEIKRESVSEC